MTKQQAENVLARKGLDYIPTGRTLMKDCGHWGELPEAPVADWMYEVANEDTRLGYWDWVEDRMRTALLEPTI